MSFSRKRDTRAAERIRNRVGLFFGTVALFWSAQLLGNDPSVVAAIGDEWEEAPRHVLVISIPDRKLAFTEDGRVLKVYSVSVGAVVTPSPTGSMKIVNKVVAPTWYNHGKVVPRGRFNPLGNRWMGLNQKRYGIHGTNAPTSIGQAVSHGCIRMGKHDVEELFNLVRVGDEVEIHGERDEQVATIFAGAGVRTASSAPPAVPAPTQISTPHANAVSLVAAAARAEAAGGQ